MFYLFVPSDMIPSWKIAKKASIRSLAGISNLLDRTLFHRRKLPNLDFPYPFVMVNSGEC